MLPEQRGEGAQLGLLKRIVEALETAGETLAQEIVGFQRQAGKGHAYRALELLQQPALHMDFQIIQYRAHRLGVRQQQDEAATGIHDAGRVGQLQPVQKMQPHGAGQRLQHEGPGPQQFARALVAAVGVGVLAKDELLDAAQIGAEQQEAFLPFGTVQPGLGDGRRSGRMVIERDIGPGAVCGGGDAPGESLQRGRQRVQIMPGPQMAGDLPYRLAEGRVQPGIGILAVRFRAREDGGILRIQRQEMVAQGRSCRVDAFVVQPDSVEDGLQPGGTEVPSGSSLHTVTARRELIRFLQRCFHTRLAVRPVMGSCGTGKAAALAFPFRGQGQHMLDEIVGMQHMAVCAAVGAILLLHALGGRGPGPLGEFAYIMQPCRKYGEFMLHAYSP